MVSAGNEFVGIDLMTGVPNQTIVTKVKLAVQGETQFHDAQVRREVGGTGGEQVAENVADFRGSGIELLRREALQRCGILETGQQRMLTERVVIFVGR